jgi:hypothetical protein
MENNQQEEYNWIEEETQQRISNKKK